MIYRYLKRQRDFFQRFTLFLLALCLHLTVAAQTVDCSINANCGDPYCQFASNIEKGCNCFDNTDNDSDGRVDKADSNCATYYGLIFVGEDADCSIVPPGANTPFDLVNAPIASAQNTADTQSKVSVGDVDGDGIPDAVITSKWNSEIRVVATAGGQADGTAAGAVKSSFNLTSNASKAMFPTVASGDISKLKFEHENLIADIDGDGISEIYGVASLRGSGPTSPPTRFFLVAFKYAEDSLVPLFTAVDLGVNRPGTFGIADMDGDGKAEIYLRDRIYAAETGALLATGNGNWDLDVTSGPVAVDITGDNKMELVCGTKIYSIPSFANRNPAAPANLTLVADMNTINPAVHAYVKLAIDPVEYGTDTHSMCSVADIDKDGNMDVVISGALNSVTGPTAVFYWNVAKGTVSYYLPTDPLYANGWPWGTGRVNLGDANGDGKMDLSFIAGSYLHCLTTDASGNLVPLWAAPRTINDTRSGVLTVSIYDFNNDGEPEMVYRDSQELVVIDGATGTQKLWSAVCQSHTYTEGPIIADVNGDGATDICVSCNTSTSFNINAGIAQQALGQFRLYYSSGNEWLPTRKVWNQPGYFVTNINDDLTLPFPQLNQNMVFGTGDCLNGLPGPQMPLNVFMNQVPYLAANGCPVYPAPDLAYFGDDPDNPGVDENGDGIYTPAVEVIPPICGDLAFKTRFNIVNDGDLPITGVIPVSFFKVDPTTASVTAADRLYTTNINIINLAVDSTLTTAFETFNGTGGTFRLYIVLNNNGTVLPIDTTAASPTECRINNNIYSLDVTPDPFTTKIEKIKDNFKCVNTSPDNGELRVRIFKAGVEVTDYSQYGFQWYTGTAASYSPIAGATNYNILGLAEGDYTAIVTNTAKGCAGLPVDTLIVRTGNDPDVVINVVSHQTVCSPPNGQLQAQITGGNVGFVFEWFDIALNPLGITGNTANNLVAGNYLVRVSKDGCSKNSLPQTVNGPVVPDAQASTLQNVVDCLNPNTGSITATALFNGVAQDPANYSFDWYFYNDATSTRGSILPGIHGSGPTRTALPVGSYQVVVTDLATKCAAVQAPVTAITSQTVIPTAVITELAPQTSCDPTKPNGRLQGTAMIGGVVQDPSAYTFEWFKGDNTLAAYAHTNVSGVKGSVAEAVAGGGVYYTLRVTTANNCFDTEKLIITENLNVPVVTLTATNNGVCDPALATSTYNGGVTASVTFAGVAVTDFTNYQITWHNGSLITDPVIAGANTTLLSQQNGGFYTIEVRRTDLGCSATPVTAEVKNVTVLPTITSTSVASTNCAGGTPNGTMSANVGGVTAGYTFKWYQGNSTGSPPVTAAKGGDTPNAFNLQGGQNYTVKVVNNATGCVNTQTTALADQSAVPILSLTQTPNSVCDASLTNPAVSYNGSITASATYKGVAVADFSTYVFEWHNGNNISAPLNNSSTTRTLSNLNAGFYTVKSTITGLNCISAPVTIEVKNTTLIPDVVYSFTNSSQCAGPPNGKADAAVQVGASTTTAGYKFEWFSGESDNLSDPKVTFVAVANGQYTPSIFGVQGSGNDYTVRVTNNATGCKKVQSMHLHHKEIKPELTNTVKHNSGCTTFDGSITADLLVAGPATYYWYTGDKVDPAKFITSGPSNVLTGQKAGTYTVTVKDDVSQCESKAYVITIKDDLVVLPTVTTSSTPSNDCAGGTPTGTTTANASGAVTGGYTYQWYKGKTFTAGQEVLAANGGTSSVTNGLPGAQNYSVQVTITSTGCKSTSSSAGSTVFVANNSVLPVLGALSSIPNTSCTATGTGTATIGTLTFPTGTNVPSPYNGFTFKWVDAVNTIKGTTSTIGSLLAGTYTLTATHTSTNCISTPVSVSVINNLDMPDLTTGSSPSTNCVAGKETGQARVVTVDGIAVAAATGYTYSWTGPTAPAYPVSAGTNTSNTGQLIKVQGGEGYNYTVLVTNQANGCQGTAVVNVTDAKVLPVVSLSAVDNTICSPATNFNGSITATVTNQIGALTDYTFSFGGGMIAGTQLSSPNHNQYTKLNGGPTAYTTTATHLITGCVSSQVSIPVTNNQDIPDITSGSTASTNCTMGAGLEDGKARAVTVDGAAATTTGYSFSWTGPAAPAFPVNVATNKSNEIELIKVQGGAGYDYTLTVTNTANGCANTAIVNVADAKVLPVITLAATDNTICAPAANYDGTVTATITNQIGALTNYIFAFADGMIAGTQLASPNHNQYTKLNGGPTAYTAIATHTPTGCVSSQVSIPVINNQDIPDITSGSTASTNCAMGTGQEDGKARAVTIDGAAATTTGYSFSWTGPAAPAFPVNVATNKSNEIELIKVQGGAGYDYALTVTNTTNGCINTAMVNVADAKELPALTLTPQDNTICDITKATGGVYDGQVLATVNTVGNYSGAVAGDFTFTWDTGLNGVGQNLLSNLNGGIYSVTVLHTNTGCQSASQSAQVNNNTVLPAITITSTPSQNCATGAPDGIASVTNVMPNGQNYDYRWFDGNSTLGTPGPLTLNTTASTDDYVNVQGGMSGASLLQYTVEVVILQTGCVNTATVGVADDSRVPVLGPLTATDNTLCSVAKNGTATVSTLDYRGAPVAPANYGDYTFSWSAGIQGPVETITALPAGTYQLTVQNNDDKCISNPVSVTIADVLFMPQIDVVDVEQTSCDPSTPNGSLTATIDETAIGNPPAAIAGYTFTWMDNVTSATAVSNQITNLKGDQNYTITAIRNSTECTTVQTVYLNETLTIPTVTVTVTDLTICAPPNGALTATDLAGHTYYWYNGNDATDEDAVIAAADFIGGNIYSGLIPEDYTLVVQDNTTKCKSQQIISTVNDTSPVISPVAANTVIPVDCNTAGGTLDAAVQFNSSDFSALAATNQLITSIPLPLAINDQVIIGRNGALALPVGLEEDKVYFIETILGNVITLKYTSGVSLQVDLTTDGDGTIGDFVTGAYDYEWYAGVPSATDASLGSINYFTNPPVYTGGPISPTSTLAGIGTGIYTIQVTDQATGCKNYLSHTLPFLGSHAVLRINKTNSTICPYTSGNGSIEIQIEDPAAAPPAVDQNDYEVTLFQGATVVVPTFIPVPPVNPFLVSTSLAPGSYVVEVRETYSSFDCPISQEVIIGADALPPVISLAADLTSNTACDVTQFNGRIDISVDKDPADLTAGTTYDIGMAPDPNTAFPLLAQPAGIYSALDLGPNSYTFTVAASTGCSASKSFTIINNPVKSELSAANISISDAEYCDVNLEQSAKVVINSINVIGGGAENLNDYQLDWYTDAALTTNILSALADGTATKGGEELSNAVAPLPSQPVTNGAYWIVATKQTDLSGTGGLGCASVPYSLSIASKKITPQITLTPFGDTSCDPTFFEGSIAVDVATASGPGMGGLYDYTWAPAGAAGQPANSAGNDGVNNIFNDINDGAYSLTALNQVTGCAATLSTTLTRETPPVFTLDAVATDLTGCGPFDGKIDGLQVFVDGAGGIVADFDYVWFKSDLLPASRVLDGQNAAVPVDVELTLVTYPAITVDKYFVKAIRKAGGAGVGCESAPLGKDILDKRVFPQVSLSQIASTACDGNFDGQITVNASTTSGPGAGANYDIVWTSDPDGLAGPLYSASDALNQASPYSTPATDLIGDGSYAVQVTNVLTSCASTATIVAQKKTVPMSIVSVTPAHVDFCLPTPVNGAGTVTDVTISGAPGNAGLFTYTWDNDPLMGSPSFINDPALTQSGLDIGTYYVRARRNAVNSPATPGITGSGCFATPFTFEVLNKRVSPMVSLSQIASTACDGNFDGQITVSASTTSGPGAGADYDIVWTSDPDGLAGPLYSASDALNQASPYSTPATDLIGDGSYAVQVTNVATSCFTTATIVLQKITVPQEIVSVTSTHVDMCLPMPANGSGTVTDAKINGIAGNAGSFTYSWDNDPLMASPFAVNDPALTQNGLDIGQYYVRAMRNAVPAPATPGVTGSGCLTAPVPFEVLDKRIAPGVSLSQIANTACDGNFEGRIITNVTTQAGTVGEFADYGYTWTTTSSTLPPPDPNAVGTETILDLSDGLYTLTAINNITSCQAVQSITLLKVSPPVFTMNVTSSPQELCAPHGSIVVNDVFLDGVSNGTGNFDFRWYLNDPGTVALQDGTPATIIGSQIDNTNYLSIGEGTYYVKAIRKPNTDPGSGCESAPLSVQISDISVNPVVTLTPFSNTACDTDFEGRITTAVSTQAGTPGELATYSYAWISSTTSTPAANPAAVGNEPVIDLEDGSYTLTATNNITACASSAITIILRNETPVVIAGATPSDQELCTPDGSVLVNSVTVNGVTDPDHNNFDFTWYKDDPATAPLASGINNDLFDITDYASIGAGAYYVKAKRNSGLQPGSGCESPPLRIDVRDISVNPVMVLTPFDNTSCDANGEGQIQTDVTTQAGTLGAGAMYSYTWVSTASTTPANDPAAVGNELIGGLAEGDYTLTATNNTTQCVTTDITTIDLAIDVVHLESVAVVNQQICNPDGSLTVTDISVNEISDAANLATNFTYAWYLNDLASPIAGVTGMTLDVTNYPAIGAGTYYVTAKRNAIAPGSGCETEPVKVEIADVSVDPAVSFTTISNTSCDNNFDGQITLTAPAPGDASNYDFTWTTFPALSTPANEIDVANVYSTTAADKIGPGSYVIQVRNRDTNCSTNVFVEMVSNPQPVEILTVNRLDQMICFPDGSIAVSAVSPAVVPDYSFSWFRNDVASLALTDGGGTPITSNTLDNSNYPAIGADSYFIVGQKNTALGSGCLTPPFKVDIEDLHADPTLAFTFAPNSSCDLVNPNGQIVATAGERDGTTDNYTFDWTLNDAALPPVTSQVDNSPTSDLSKAFEDSYALVVTNTITGCTLMSGTKVNLDHNVSMPNIIIIDTIDPLDCLGSGSAEVTAVSIGGNPPITDSAILSTGFVYNWYRSNYVPGQKLAETGPLLQNAQPGTLFVTVKDLSTQCVSEPPSETVILPDDIIYPVVTIAQTALQVRCVIDEGTAELVARGDGNTDTDPDYQFSWFNNLDTSGPSFSNSSTASDLLQGEYSVLVTNNATGCAAFEIYVVRDDSETFTPKLSLNTEERTDCLVPDGALLAREVGYDPNDLGYPYPSANYSAEFYPGANPDVSQPGTVMVNVPGFNRNWREASLDVGSYTVKITDNNTGCIVTGVRVVEEGRVLPIVTIIEDNPLINCDPARPNGQLSATADGGQVGEYLFDWYSGTIASGAVMGSNNKLIGLPMGDYTVRVTNDFTNCFADATSDISDGRLYPPSPTAQLVFDRTRCDYPDGWVTAHVGGITFNYSFDWYDGTALKAAPDFNGVNYQNRDIGLYTVTAMDEITGCISKPTSVEVKDMRVIPEVIVHTTPSFCEELPGSVGGSGTAEIELKPADVVSDEVIWTMENDGTTIGIGSYLTNVLPGFYQANVLTSQGCPSSGVGEVKTEIFSYNLVSMNGDQKNDNFRIDCISKFPNNNVKIFNRAGVLVYDADGYDNNDVVFNGRGEKGLYPIGNELPVGTYFYIIDKSDGSKPKSGYLELVR